MGVIPVPGFSKIALLAANWDRAVHLFQSLFSVPVSVYSRTRWLYAHMGGLPKEGFPTVAKVMAYAFLVRRVVSSALRIDHQSHPGVVPSLSYQLMPREKKPKISLVAHGLA